MFRRFACNAPVSLRLFAASAPAILGMVGLALFLISQQVRTARDMERTRELVRFATISSDFVHELQKERGISAVLLTNGAQQLIDELPRQRQRGTERLAIVRAAIASLDLAAYPAAVGQRITAAIEATQALDVNRADITARRLTAAQSFAFYSGLIDKFLAIPQEVVRSSSDPALSTALLAYGGFINGKERAGQERAFGAVGFAAGHFNSEQHRNFLNSVFRQQFSLGEFQAYATPEQRAAVDRIMIGPTVDQVMQMRAIALAADPGTALANTALANTALANTALANTALANTALANVDGPTWFHAATARIDLMKQAEDALASDLARIADAVATSALWVAVLTGTAAVAVLALSLGLIVLLTRTITRPLAAMTTGMDTLARGDSSVTVPALNHKDELGRMARAMQVFKENKITADRLAHEQAAERVGKEQRAIRLEALSRAFETRSGELVGHVSAAATELQATAESMSGIANETTHQAVAVAAAAEQATLSVQTVASAAEELASSVAEISRQVAQSARITSLTVEDSKNTDTIVRNLAESAQQIGEVLGMISDIAGQTNLLALNATIEAARAGDAGKGFAVVASEVKSLANQTAKATEQISQQIAGIQSATKEAVISIQGVGARITEISGISATIAAAVEQQGSATQEIARSVQRAAVGTAEVTLNIAGVSDGAGNTSAAATQVFGAASGLSRQAEQLDAEVGQFIAGIKAA